ncbi:MAG: prepilin-type N-terminal cleavage/methylation domain-containing protein [Leptolyngbya sp. Prado105]|jgi:prepilin-type N-terminal cleavage/methylation domain-containing protein|nr:prepilin-type N-terminal cleavage/methylation domain-containing protein [Leptolyngbya sp. Prado105]
MNLLGHKNQIHRVRAIRAIVTILHQRQQIARNGFTLLETIVVMVLIGILFAIAAPAWQAFLNGQRLNTATDKTFSVISETKNRARQQHIPYEIGVRQASQQVQWAIYPVGADPINQTWQNLNDGVKLLETETTISKKDNIYRIRFNHRGEVNGQWGRVTFIATSGGHTKRCAIVFNLLGAIREGENRPNQDKNRCD